MVNATKRLLETGLYFVKSLVVSQAQEAGGGVSELCDLLLEGPLGKGARLVGGLGFETYVVSMILFGCGMTMDLISHCVARICRGVARTA